MPTPLEISPLLLDALAWADRLVFAAVRRARARGRALGKDAPWGAYVGEAEVDAIIEELLGVAMPAAADSARLAAHLEASRTRWLDHAELGASPLGALAARFGLSGADLELLVLALAPEVNARYRRLFAWLQDDLGRQQLSTDLALSLLRDDRPSRWALAGRLAPGAPLRRLGLLVQGEGGPDELRLAPRIVRWLLHAEALDPELEPWVTVHARGAQARRDAVSQAVSNLAAGLADGGDDAIVRLDARSRRGALEAALELARSRRCGLIEADLRQAAWLGVDLGRRAPQLAREARLLDAVVLVLEPPEPDERGVDPLGGLLVASRGAGQPLLVQAAPSGVAVAGGASRRQLGLSLPPLGIDERQRAWRRALGSRWSDEVVARLARRFRFSEGQIDAVVEDAAARARAGGKAAPDEGDLAQACAQAGLPEPGPLAQRVLVARGWDDLVLPPEPRALLREMVSQVEQRDVVLEALGARGRSGDRGVQALFSGPPGTGKSMAAEVLAGELGYPLLRVDLSAVVSKWVGETEKLLGRLFREAEQGSCVLFFDEADALFGRRSEVKGAQDRFANLEVSYLLQRLESFDGVAVLTTNLKRNIDEAFLRRFTYVVDFPFPEAPQRLAIWRRLLVDAFPLAPDVDLEQVAAEFKLAGGNIWNVAVAASCAAAESSERRITRRLLAHAVLREYQKMGREISALKPRLLESASESRARPAAKSRPKRALSAAEARRARERQGEP